ncbi:MAG: response regulator [Ruminococcus sp.]|nr:response regulator [Ruminococcus sp.]
MDFKDIKILVCDDSMFARKKMGMFLSSLGIVNIAEAADGEEAVAKYKDVRPDLVFMDIVMPKLTGIDALKAIKEFDSGAKVVMASSVGTQSHLKQAIVLGAYDFVQKPIDDAQVEKIIRNAMK